MKIKLLAFILIFACSFHSVFSQEASEENTDTIPQAIEKIQSDIFLLNKLKVSGYVQTQWQKADTIGISSVAGGDFKGLDNRFNVRRGRLKFAHQGDMSQIVGQLEISEKGVSTKEIYGLFTEPWLQTISITGGLYNRPFGNEVEFSSSSLESPERSRIVQSLFPGECDLGGKLTIQAPKTSNWNVIKLDAGLFTGNGIAIETDKYKDLITHLSFKKSFLDEKLSVSGGASYYMGGWAAQDTNVYKMGTLTDGITKGFVRSSITKGSIVKREYIGFDAQINLETAIGISSLRAEYIFGQQPATDKTINSPTGIYLADPTYTNTINRVSDSITSIETKINNTVYANPYIRQFSGGYITFVQGIGQTKNKFVVKYDWYDPNTEVSGNEIGQTSTFSNKKLTNPTKLSAIDLKYSTIGFGWIYNWNSNVRLTAYYDMVSNETTNATGLSADAKNDGTKLTSKDRKDNVFTFRILFKF